MAIASSNKASAACPCSSKKPHKWPVLAAHTQCSTAVQHGMEQHGSPLTSMGHGANAARQVNAGFSSKGGLDLQHTHHIVYAEFSRPGLQGADRHIKADLTVLPQVRWGL